MKTELIIAAVLLACWLLTAVVLTGRLDAEKSAHLRDQSTAAQFRTQVAIDASHAATQLAASLKAEQDRRNERDALEARLDQERTAWSADRETLRRSADAAILKAKNADPSLAALSARAIPPPWVDFMRQPLTNSGAAAPR